MAKQSMAKTKRILQPTIVQTKQELLAALKSGAIITSKYNLLSEKEKLFVELLVFGGYTGTQAMRVIDPNAKQPTYKANRMLSNPDVAETLEELSEQKDKKFMTEVQSAQDLALSKLLYIMSTTSDEVLAASVAKTIAELGHKVKQSKKVSDEGVSQVVYSIQVENVYAGNPGLPQGEPVIIEIDEEEEERMEAEAEAKKLKLKSEVDEVKEELAEVKKKAKRTTKKINPETGLPYTFAYEGVDNYKK